VEAANTSSSMKLLLLALTYWLAATQVQGDSYGGLDTCLDPLALKDRFLPNSALLSDVEDALGACISVNERKAKKKKTTSKKKVSKKEEEKPSKKSSSKKGKAKEEEETAKKKSTSKSKKSSSKDDEPSKKSSKKSPSKGGKGDEEETQGKKKTSKKEEPNKKSSKGGKGSEEETQGKKKTSKKEEPSKKSSKKSTSKKEGSKKKQSKEPLPQPPRPEPPQCQTFEDIVDQYDDIVCVMEFLGWSDVNGTLNETLIYNDVLTDPLLTLFYDDIYSACLQESDGERAIETVVEPRCIPSFTGEELLQLGDLMETTQAFLCWDSFVNKALLTWSKMVLGTPTPVIDVFGTQAGE